MCPWSNVAAMHIPDVVVALVENPAVGGHRVPTHPPELAGRRRRLISLLGLFPQGPQLVTLLRGQMGKRAELLEGGPGNDPLTVEVPGDR